MILTSFIRLFFGRRLRPYKLKTIKGHIPDFPHDSLGIYIHIPFCKSICPFCPYYKVPYDKDLLNSYIDSLKREIELVGKRISYRDLSINSIYFGGGTPALALYRLVEIITCLKSSFHITGPIGIELNPQDITIKQLETLKRCGFTMVSIGVQSFSKEINRILGRSYNPVEDKIKMVSKVGFNVIDIDLIIGIKGQNSKDISNDFSKAFELGATQISTYPFIDFSYLGNRIRHYGERYKRKFINSLYSASRKMDLKRDSIWTFKKRGYDPYTSVTRDSYIGFGASAASLGVDSFKTNIFSINEYIKCVDRGEIPTNLTMIFNKRSRALYWLFWNCYRGVIDDRRFYSLFNKSIQREFKYTLILGRILGFWIKSGRSWKLTDRGLYLFHLIEQHYTHQYIDKTWRISMEEPWVDHLKLY